MQELITTAKIVKGLKALKYYREAYSRHVFNAIIDDKYSVQRIRKHHERGSRLILEYTIKRDNAVVAIIRTTEEKGARSEISFTYSECINPKKILNVLQ